MPKVEKPIFIVGTGRCGSTIFHQVISHHPQVAWLSRYCDTRPSKPHLNRRAMQALDLPLVTPYVRRLVYPVEAYSFWNYYTMGAFERPCRDLCAEDVTMRVKKSVQNVMAAMLTEKRDRLLIKVTGWPRIGFLKEIFPDAKFIHVYRDGRPVVNSWLGVRWWLGWLGPENWQWGALPPERQLKWEKYNRSFVALAAIGWEMLMEAHEQARQKLPPEDFMEIRYEDICENPTGVFKAAAEFAALPWSSEFEAAIHQYAFKSADHKWRDNLTETQQAILNDCLENTLKKYGYEL